MQLTHLTLNTGHLSRSARRDVDPTVEAHLLPLLDSGGGPIPGMAAYHLDFIFPRSQTTGARRDGYAFFQIRRTSAPFEEAFIMAVTAWRAGTPAWEGITKSYGLFEAALGGVAFWRPAPTREPPWPWLAVCLTPFLAKPPVPAPADLMAFGDLERCIAWSLIP